MLSEAGRRKGRGMGGMLEGMLAEWTLRSLSRCHQEQRLQRMCFYPRPVPDVLNEKGSKLRQLRPFFVIQLETENGIESPASLITVDG